MTTQLALVITEETDHARNFKSGGAVVTQGSSTRSIPGDLGTSEGPVGRLSGVGVKARVATAKRLGLDAHGTTPASVSGGRGCSSPCPPSPRRQEWGVQRGKAPLGKDRRAAASKKKPLPTGQAFSRPQAVLFRGKASPRAEPY